MAKSNYTYEDIIEALRKIDIVTGDTVFLHTNIGFFGRLENAKTADALCEGFFDALQEVVGKEGTIVVPTFSYSFCHQEEYDPVNTPTTCGMFSEYVRKQDGVIRSLDPNFSVAAWGRLAAYYTGDPSHESFGKGSFWERFLKEKGKIVCMNMDCGSTFVHYVECCNQVDYRYNKAFNGILTDYQGNRKKDYFVHYVYDLDKPEDGPFFPRLHEKYQECGLCREAALGKGIMRSMKSEEYFTFISDTLKKEPRFLTIGGDIFV